MKKLKGFTLVELMVVVSIIAILTAIVLANLGQSRAKSRDAKRVSDVNQIQLALTLFFDRCNTYPTGPLTPASSVAGCSFDFSSFLSKIPTDPTGSAYLYAVDCANSPVTDFHLGTVLETTSASLQDKVGFNSSALAWCGGFNGTNAGNPKIYDVRSH